MSAVHRVVARWAAGRLKWVVASILSTCGVLAWLRRRLATLGQVPVLMFHRVVSDSQRREPLSLPAPLFAEFVQAAGRRYRLASWSEAVVALRGRSGTPHLVVTFDDGYAEHAGTAWPLISSAGGSAVFFITVGPPTGTRRFWWDVVAAWHQTTGSATGELDRSGTARFSAAAMTEIGTLQHASASALAVRVHELEARLGSAVQDLPQSLSWTDVRRLADEGAEIGGHGVSHAILTVCSDGELAAEVHGSRDALSQQGNSPQLFAYPDGAHDERVVAALREAGFCWGFTTQPGYFTMETDPLRVPRIDVSVAMCSPNGRTFSWALFEAELLGVFDTLLLRRWRRMRAARRTRWCP
jgi:peptidoglycan/xylan/chitin deacetylase (PgdA/CDA1 family)